MGRYKLFVEGVRIDNLEGGVESGGESPDQFLGPAQHSVGDVSKSTQIRDSLELFGAKAQRRLKSLFSFSNARSWMVPS